MKYTGYGVEDSHCQDRGRTTNIFNWISSTFKIKIDKVGEILINVETIEREINERFKSLANAFGDLKITPTEVTYRNTIRKTNVVTPLFHISGEKTIPLWYNTSAWELFLRSESDFQREFRDKVFRASDVDTMLSLEIKQLLQGKVKKNNPVIDQNLPNITSKVEGKKRLKKSRSRDTKDKTESSDEEFTVTDEKESVCKVRSLVFNTTDEQTKILNDIINDESHQDLEDYKYIGKEPVSWGGMKRLLSEEPLSTTNDSSQKRITNEVVNFYLKNCLSTNGLLKFGQETSQGNFFFFNTFLYQALLQEKNKNIGCCGTYDFKSVENWTNKLIKDTNLTKLFNPINIDNIHWVLIVVDIIQRSIHYYDSCYAKNDEQEQRPKNIEHFMNDFETKKVPCKNNPSGLFI